MVIWGVFDWLANRWLSIESETVVTADFQFSKGIELRGRALTSAGKPVSGAKITNITEVSDWFREYGNKTDEQGEFTVAGLEAGRKLVLKAEHSKLGLRGKAEVEVQPGASVEIQMERYDRVKVSGRVLNRRGEPIPSVNVVLMHQWDGQDDPRLGSTVTMTDGGGRFRDIELIVGDEYVIRADADGYLPVETGMFTPDSQMTQVSDLILLPAPTDPYFIEGRVTDNTGQPVGGAYLETNHRSQHWMTQTDDSGDYRLNNLSMAVVMQLHINHPEYAFHTFRILKTNQRHDLVLVKAVGYIAGKVVDTKGSPIENVSVTVEPQEDYTTGQLLHAVYTNSQGAFELKHINDPFVSIAVRTDQDYKSFDRIAVNQRDLVLTLTPNEPRPETAPEQQAQQEAQWSYYEAAHERFKTLVGQPAPDLAVAEWLSGPPASIGQLKGKTIIVYFWDLNYVDDRVQRVRLLNILQEVYGKKGIVFLAICPATEKGERIKRRITEQSLSYSVGLDRSTAVVGAKGETSDQYAIGRYPFILINAAGEIAGRASGHDLEAQIQTLLAD